MKLVLVVLMVVLWWCRWQSWGWLWLGWWCGVGGGWGVVVVEVVVTAFVRVAFVIVVGALWLM